MVAYTCILLTNAVLSVATLGLAAYSYNNSYLVVRMDQIFMGVVGFCFLVTCVLGCISSSSSTTALNLGRFICAAALLVSGGFLIHSAFQVDKKYRNIYCGKDTCQEYPYKIAAGALAIINGLVHLSFKPNNGQMKKEIPCSFPQPQQPVYAVYQMGQMHGQPLGGGGGAVVQQYPAALAS